MPLILTIDTSTENASICLAENEECLCLLTNDEQKNHAAWLHPAIQQACATAGKSLKHLHAVGITAGPGSYTGLRVGMAAAKGLCYALHIPFITINTLEAMAVAGREEKADLLCPMIDARRMEVFTAVYTRALVPVLPPCAMVLDEHSFHALLQENEIVFYGNGKNKFASLTRHRNAITKDVPFNAARFITAINRKFIQLEFSSLAYAEPQYLKEHYAPFLTKSV